MKLCMVAVLSMVCSFAIAAATGGAAPVAASPAAPSIGACRWFCGADPTRYTSQLACEAACSTQCDEVC